MCRDGKEVYRSSSGQEGQEGEGNAAVDGKYLVAVGDAAGVLAGARGATGARDAAVVDGPATVGCSRRAAGGRSNCGATVDHHDGDAPISAESRAMLAATAAQEQAAAKAAAAKAAAAATAAQKQAAAKAAAEAQANLKAQARAKTKAIAELKAQALAAANAQATIQAPSVKHQLARRSNRQRSWCENCAASSRPQTGLTPPAWQPRTSSTPRANPQVPMGWRKCKPPIKGKVTERMSWTLHFSCLGTKSKLRSFAFAQTQVIAELTMCSSEWWR